MEVKEIPVQLLKPFPLETRYERVKVFINDLAEDIKKHGIINPLIVVEVKDGYVIIDGHYRYYAARELGLEKVPCIVISSSALLQDYVKGISVNLKRKRYNALDLAVIAKTLHDRFGFRYAQIAEMLGVSRMHLYRCIYVLEHALEEEKRAYLMGKISFRELYRIVKQREKDGKPVYICPVCHKECSAEDSIVLHVHRKCYEKLKEELFNGVR